MLLSSSEARPRLIVAKDDDRSSLRATRTRLRTNAVQFGKVARFDWILGLFGFVATSSGFIFQLMAAGILSGMEGKRGIRAWRWYVFSPHFPYTCINSTAQAVLYRGIEYILGISAARI